MQGADPAARDGEARTPLHHAVMRGHCGVVDVLLSRGGPALLLAKDILGCTPVHLAAVQNQVRCKAKGAVLCCVHGLQTGCWSMSRGSFCWKAHSLFMLAVLQLPCCKCRYQYPLYLLHMCCLRSR